MPDSIESVMPFLAKLQDGVIDALSSLTEVPLLDFVWKKDVILALGSNQIAHGLGRAWRGYIVTRANGSATVYAPDEQQLRDRFLDLESTGDVVMDLFVF